MFYRVVDTPQSERFHRLLLTLVRADGTPDLRNSDRRHCQLSVFRCHDGHESLAFENLLERDSPALCYFDRILELRLCIVSRCTLVVGGARREAFWKSVSDRGAC